MVLWQCILDMLCQYLDILCINMTIILSFTYVTLDQISFGINKLCIDVWFVRIQLFENLESEGAKKISKY